MSNKQFKQSLIRMATFKNEKGISWQPDDNFQQNTITSAKLHEFLFHLTMVAMLTVQEVINVLLGAAILIICLAIVGKLALQE